MHATLQQDEERTYICSFFIHNRGTLRGILENRLASHRRLLTVTVLTGVCVDGNEESVSVTAGNSVTLKSDFTEIQTDDKIEWRFNGTRIAKISSDSIEILVKSDGSFRDRLQLDNQTGDLKISNISTTDSGEYKVKISSPRRSPPEMKFNVKVVPSPVKSVSVKEGDPVTLNTDLTEIQRDDVIQWRFGQQKSPVAEINRTSGINTYDGPDGKFKDRLKLDQTGSLTIKNTRITDSGLYEVEISSSSSRYTRHYTRSFGVTVSALPGPSLSPAVPDPGLSPDHLDPRLSSDVPDPRLSPAVPDPSLSSDGPGLSPAAVAGIGVGGLLLAAATGLFYYRYKRSKENRPNHALNGTQDTADCVNEETELTNAS